MTPPAGQCRQNEPPNGDLLFGNLHGCPSRVRKEAEDAGAGWTISPTFLFGIPLLLLPVGDDELVPLRALHLLILLACQQGSWHLWGLAQFSGFSTAFSAHTSVFFRILLSPRLLRQPQAVPLKLLLADDLNLLGSLCAQNIVSCDLTSN